MSQLPINLKRIDIDMTDRLGATAVAAVELKCSNASPLHLTDEASFLHGLACGDFVWSKAANGVAFGDDPSTATSRCDEIDVGGTVPTKMKRQRAELTKFLFSDGHSVAYLKLMTSA